MPPAAATSPPGRLDALTSLRFFAALHVLLFHLQALGPWPVPAAVTHLLGSGFVAVSFFFVLSGFILTVSYASRPPAQHLRAWAVSRFARIYPLYALGLLLMLPAWLKIWAAAPSVAAPLLLQAWVPSWALAWNPPAWSLSVEALFYLLFPFLLPWVLRAPLRRVWTVAGLAWLSGLALAVGYLLANPDGLGRVDDSAQGIWLNALKFHPLVRLPEFVVGLALGRTFLAGSWPRLGWWGALAAVALLAGLMVSDRVPFPVLHDGLFTPLFALVIAASAQGGTSALRRLLAHRALVMLGEASYALYILQAPLLSLVHGVARRASPSLVHSPWGFSAVALLVTVGGALAAWALVERPLRSWLVKHLSAS